MFQFQKQDLDYEVAMSTFRDQALNKNMLLQQYIYEFEKIIQANYSVGRTNVQVVKFCRRIIEEVQTIVINVKAHLNQIGLEFFNQLVYKMFKILIISFNTLSQKFILALKGRNKTEQSQQKPQIKKQSSKSKYQNIKSQQKQMEYFDFIIRNLEQQQLKLEKKKKIMEKQLISEGRSIENITASDTVHQLQNLNKDIQKIILNSEKIAGQNVLYRYQQLSKRILSLKKPQQIKEQFCNNFSGHIKSKFMSTMEKIIKQLYFNIRQKQKEQLTQQILGAKPILVEMSIQTQSDAKTAQISGLIRQKKNLMNDIETLKKANSLLEKQIQKIGDKLKQSKQINQTLEKKVNSCDDILKKKAAQIQKIKTQFQMNISKKIQVIQNLNKTNQELKNLINSTQSECNQSIKQEDKLDQVFSESGKQTTNISTSKSRSFFRDRMSNVLYFQKQLKEKRKQNSLLRLGLFNVLDKLKQSQIISKYQQSEVNQDLKSGHFTQKIDQIIIELTSKISNGSNLQNYQQPKGKNLQRERKTTIRSNDNKIMERNKKIAFKIDYGTQTFQCFSKQQQKYLKQDTRIKTGESIEKSINKTNRLQALKKQFIQKISSKKKNVDYRLNKRYQLHETYDSSDVNNLTAQNYNVTQQQTQNNQNRQKKPKPLFSRKDISFEEFKLSQIHNNKTQVTNANQPKKAQNKIQKKQIVFQETLETISKQKLNQQRTSKPIIAIQSYEIYKEVNACLNLIEMKNDKKDYFLKNFIKLLLEQFKKKKGKTFIENILKNQISELVQNLKVEPKVEKPEQIGQFVVKTLR